VPHAQVKGKDGQDKEGCYSSAALRRLMKDMGGLQQMQQSARGKREE
jgi:hypothetical protein